MHFKDFVRETFAFLAVDFATYGGNERQESRAKQGDDDATSAEFIFGLLIDTISRIQR